MYRAFTSQGSHRWVDILDKLVAGYNNTYHRSIKMKPKNVNSANEARVRRNLFPALPPPQPAKYKVGETVRITRKKSAFQKGYEQSWSHEVFKVKSIKATNPVTYQLEDFNGVVKKGSFYSAEIQSVDKSNNIWQVDSVVRQRTVRGRKQYLVKWKGYPDSFNSWVDHKDLFKL